MPDLDTMAGVKNWGQGWNIPVSPKLISLSGAILLNYGLSFSDFGRDVSNRKDLGLKKCLNCSLSWSQGSEVRLRG